MSKIVTIYMIGIFLFILSIILIGVLIEKTFTEVDKAQVIYKGHLGEQFIMGKDTLLIMDYSIVNETFTLSNGKVINCLLVTDKNK